MVTLKIHYQRICQQGIRGYLKPYNNKMLVLSPHQKITIFAVDFTTVTETSIPLEAVLVDEAIAYYQTASNMFKRGSV